MNWTGIYATPAAMSAEEWAVSVRWLAGVTEGVPKDLRSSNAETHFLGHIGRTSLIAWGLHGGLWFAKWRPGGAPERIWTVSLAVFMFLFMAAPALAIDGSQSWPFVAIWYAGCLWINRAIEPYVRNALDAIRTGAEMMPLPDRRWWRSK